MDLPGSGYSLMAVSCDHGNKTSGFTKDGEFTD